VWLKAGVAVGRAFRLAKLFSGTVEHVAAVTVRADQLFGLVRTNSVIFGEVSNFVRLAARNAAAIDVALHFRIIGDLALPRGPYEKKGRAGQIPLFLR
jgi:hypothetical protein